jgi:hypothetical protein
VAVAAAATVLLGCLLVTVANAAPRKPTSTAAGPSLAFTWSAQRFIARADFGDLAPLSCPPQRWCMLSAGNTYVSTRPLAAGPTFKALEFRHHPIPQHGRSVETPIPGRIVCASERLCVGVFQSAASVIDTDVYATRGPPPACKATAASSARTD